MIDERTKRCGQCTMVKPLSFFPQQSHAYGRLFVTDPTRMAAVPLAKTLRAMGLDEVADLLQEMAGEWSEWRRRALAAEAKLARLRDGVLIGKIAMIRKAPNVCGGAARIRNTRIGVWTIVWLRQLGASDDELLENYPGLTPVDLEEANSYYKTHKQEIDDRIALEDQDE